MSKLPRASNPLKTASAVQAEAAHWLERSERADWDGAAKAELDAWLAQSPAHMIAFLRVRDVWQRAERLQALTPSVPENAAPPERRVKPVLLALAAGLGALAVLGVVGARYVITPQVKTYSTDIGGRELVAFADGTQIELNTNTVVRTRMTTQSRTVWLDKGEAYFRVHHDPAHPFTVITDGHRITDVGTKFVVRRDAGRLEVALLEGRVRFGAADAKSNAGSDLLTAGDQAVATANSVSVQKVPLTALKNELSWRSDMLVFNHTTLAEAAREINRYNRRKLVVADPSVGRLTIGGTFAKNDIGALTSAARELFNLRVEEHGDEIVISR
ncbi:MAG TPA: FecR domain-containing protein [Rhizomicrobium sp.]|nr:FecR domain-containing protein [Rhizomicrobium sp.]